MNLQPLHRRVETEVACAHCGHAFTAELHVVADAADDPALAAAARRGKVNHLSCPACRRRFTAASPVLYVEPARRLAVAYVPADAGPDVGGMVDMLVGLYLRTARLHEVADYLLEPQLCRAADEFHDSLADEPAAPRQTTALHPLLDEARRWLEEHDEPEVAVMLDRLAAVHSQAALVELLNDRAELLDPAAVTSVSLAADAAETDGRRDVAEALRDVAALLRMHTPPAELDPSEAQLAVQAALTADSPELAANYLEPPRRPDDDAVRELTGYDEPSQREGFVEHAKLFGGLLDDMMAPQAPIRPDELGEFDEPLPEPEPAVELPADALDELLACPGLDLALEVLAQHPALISHAAVETLEGLAAEALDEGDEVRASQIRMLIDAISVAGLDEDDNEEEEEPA